MCGGGHAACALCGACVCPNLPANRQLTCHDLRWIFICAWGKPRYGNTTCLVACPCTAQQYMEHGYRVSHFKPSAYGGQHWSGRAWHIAAVAAWFGTCALQFGGVTLQGLEGIWRCHNSVGVGGGLVVSQFLRVWRGFGAGFGGVLQFFRAWRVKIP